jgi:hypothetical protein
MLIDTTDQQNILAQLGDQDTQTLTAYAGAFWNIRSDKAAIRPGLQFQYTLRDCCDVLIGQVWNQISTAAGDLRVELREKIRNLQQIRENAQAEIVALEDRARANRAPAVGVITATEPVAPGPNVEVPNGPYSDPGDPAYRGDPMRQSVPTEPPF